MSRSLFRLLRVVPMMHTCSDVSNPNTAYNRENIVELGGRRKEITDSQYDKSYGDSPNIIFFHILQLGFYGP